MKGIMSIELGDFENLAKEAVTYLLSSQEAGLQGGYSELGVTSGLRRFMVTLAAHAAAIAMEKQ
jgi:hypothetical protein